MTALKFLGAVAAVAAILIGYTIMTVQTPDDMSYKQQARTTTGIGRIIRYIADTASMFGADNLNVIRTLVRAVLSMKLEDNPNVKIEVAVFDGVPVRIIDPIGRKPGGPAIVFFHGGGWVRLEPESFDTFNSVMAEETKFLVVSVDYRLAPEHRFPAALIDCEKATQYLISRAERYKIDPKRVAVMGDSAGGNLAAAVSLSMRDKKIQNQPKIQVPIYPVLQGLDFNLPSYQNDTRIVLSGRDMYYYVLAYLLGTKMEQMDAQTLKLAKSNRLYSDSVWKKHGHKIAHSSLPKRNFHQDYREVPIPKDNVGFSKELDKLVVDPLFSPVMSEDLSGLPEALILTCQYDVLRDESFLYANRLKQAGVKVTHFHDMHCYHGLILVNYRDPMLMKMYQYLVDHL